MKRMLIIWSGLFVLVILGAWFHPPLSPSTNPWTVNVLILLGILWVIELGLVHYRSRAHDIEKFLHESHMRSHARQRDERYISQHNKDT